MSIKSNVPFRIYTTDARTELNKEKQKLLNIEESFQTRMEHKSVMGIIGSIAGTLIWLVAYCVLFILIHDSVSTPLLLASIFAVIALIFLMMIDHFVSFSYYSRISGHLDQIKQMIRRVDNGLNNMDSQTKVFMEAARKGWEYPLTAAPSISEASVSVAQNIANMASLKNGFLTKAKTVFFFIAAIVLSGLFCTALYDVAENIILSLAGDSSDALDGDVLSVLLIIGLVIACIIEIVLARLVWVGTNCTVTNITLLITAASPLIYLALIAVVTLVVVLVILAVQLVISVVSVLLVGAVAYSCLCGG